jgi:hypothetical protein
MFGGMKMNSKIKIWIVVSLVIGFFIGGALAELLRPQQIDSRTPPGLPEKLQGLVQPDQPLVSTNCIGAYESGTLWYCCNGQCSVSWLRQKVV